MAAADSPIPLLLMNRWLLCGSRIARIWMLTLALCGGMGMQDVWGQARRQAIQGLIGFAKYYRAICAAYAPWARLRKRPADALWKLSVLRLRWRTALPAWLVASGAHVDHFTHCGSRCEVVASFADAQWE